MRIHYFLIIILFAGCSSSNSQDILEGMWEMRLSKSGTDTVFFADKPEITEKYFLLKVQQQIQEANPKSLSPEDSSNALKHAAQVYNLHEGIELMFRGDSMAIFNRKDLESRPNYKPDTSFLKVSGDTVYATGMNENLGNDYFILQPNQNILFREHEDESGQNIRIEFKKEN